MPLLLRPSPQPQNRTQGFVGPKKTIGQRKRSEILAAIEEFREAVAPGFCGPQKPLVTAPANPVAELGRAHAMQRLVRVD